MYTQRLNSYRPYRAEIEYEPPLYVDPQAKFYNLFSLRLF
jgi:hypothetical protein